MDIDRSKHRSGFARGYGLQAWNPRGSMAIRKRSSGPTQQPPMASALAINSQLAAATAAAAAAASSSSAFQSSNGSPDPANGAAVGASSSAFSPSSPTPTKSIEMFCAENDTLLVAVFVNSDYDKHGATIASQLLASFCSHFQSQLVSSQIGLDRTNGQSTQEDLGADTRLLPVFASFREVIERSGVMRVEPKLVPPGSPGASGAPGSASDLASIAAAAGGFSPMPSPADYSPLQYSSSLPMSNRGGEYAHHRLGGGSAASSPRGQRFTAGSMPDTGGYYAPDYGRSTGGKHASSSSAAAIAAAAAAAAAAQAQEDYMPSWLSDTDSHALLQEGPSSAAATLAASSSNAGMGGDEAAHTRHSLSHSNHPPHTGQAAPAADTSWGSPLLVTSSSSSPMLAASQPQQKGGSAKVASRPGSLNVKQQKQQKEEATSLDQVSLTLRTP